MAFEGYRHFVCSPLLLRVIAALAVSSSLHSVVRASILVPNPVTFSAADLAKSLSPKSAGSTGATDHAPFTQAGRDGKRLADPMDAIKGGLPNGSSSSSSSSSSTSGGAGFGMGCTLAAVVVIPEDRTLNRSADDYGFALPDPPGNRLLRPPRNS